MNNGGHPFSGDILKLSLKNPAPMSKQARTIAESVNFDLLEETLDAYNLIEIAQSFYLNQVNPKPPKVVAGISKYVTAMSSMQLEDPDPCCKCIWNVYATDGNLGSQDSQCGSYRSEGHWTLFYKL